MRRLFALLLLLCASSFSVAAAPGEITPERLTCEGMEHPNCIDLLQPRLSWINRPLNDQIKGAEQRAYRIRVASSREGLAKPDLWDSRRVESGESLYIPYAGKPLQSGQQV